MMFDIFAAFTKVSPPPLKFSPGSMLPGLEPTHRFSRASVVLLNDKPWRASVDIQECKSGKVAQSLIYDLSDKSYLQLVDETSGLGLKLTESIMRVTPKEFAYHAA